MTGRKAWLAAVLLPLAAQAPAQSVNDFRLQPASPTPTVRPQGPTDRDAPVVRPLNAPSAAPATASPTPASKPAPKPSPSARAPSPAPVPAAKPSARPSPTPSPEEPEETASAETSEPPSPSPLPTSEPAPDPTHTHFATAMPEGAVGAAGPAWWWALLPVALLVLAAGWAAARRRVPEEESLAIEPEELSALIATWGGEPVPAPAPPPPPESATVPAAPPPPLPRPELSPLPAPAAAPLDIALEPVRMTATIVSTLFAYRLSLTNPGKEATGPIHVAGSIIGAHASLPVEQQLATDGQILELLHELPGLEAGETRVLTGDLRLPLNLIDPIHAGDALLFVPITRFRAELAGEEVLAAFVVGESPASPGAGLLPLRLDLGPRIWQHVSARRLVIAPGS